MAASPGSTFTERFAALTDPRMERGNRFALVHVDAPIAVCKARDTKGMYAKARRGEITGFTDMDDPYEAPAAPDIVCHTDSGETPEGRATCSHI